MTAKSISKEDLLKMFGSSGLSDKTNKQKQSKDDILIQEDYRKSNHSLIVRNHQLKAEIILGRKQLDKLRVENEQLRERIRILENGEHDEKIELLVSERLEKKLAQLDYIGSRTVQYLLRSAEDFKDVLRSMGVNTTSTSVEDQVMGRPETLSALGKPLLGAIEESPFRFSTRNNQKSITQDEMMEESKIPGILTTRCPSVVSGEGTPKVERCSQSLQNAVLSSPPAIKSNYKAKRNSSFCDIVTPARKAHEDDLSTPHINLSDFSVGETDTIRKKRTATMKIKSMIEPKLNTKLRRPGKYDEPNPLVSSF